MQFINGFLRILLTTMTLSSAIRSKSIKEAFKVTFHNADKNTFTGRKGSDCGTV